MSSSTPECSVDSASRRWRRPSALSAQALELLAELVRSLPDDDERMLVLSTLAVRGGQFAPGPGTEHALSQFEATSRGACDAFLTNLVRIARDDAIAPRSARWSRNRVTAAIGSPLSPSKWTRRTIAPLRSLTTFTPPAA